MSAPNAERQTTRSATILMIIGFGLVASAAALTTAALFRKVTIPEGVVSLLLLGVGAIVISGLLPKIRSLKLSKDGVAIDLQDLSHSLNDQIVALTARIGALEVADAQPGSARGIAEAKEWKDAPAELDRPGKFDDDPRRGRFGGSAMAEDLRLEVQFGRHTADWAEVVLAVEPVDAGVRSMNDVPAVEFFLHDSFPTPRIKTPVVDGKAKLALTSWGGFTVGVWVPARQAVLELNLANIPAAPNVIRER